MNITKCKNLTELHCDDNELTDLDVSNNQELTVLTCSANSLTTIDLSNSLQLNMLDCSNNSLDDINLPLNHRLLYLDCSNNNLTHLSTDRSFFFKMNCSNNALCFSTLNFSEYTFLRNYTYSPQTVIDGGTVKCGETIDLSSEFLKNGKETQYRWYESGEEILFDGKDGIYVVPESFAGVNLTCRMTNDTFPKLTLRYKVSIEAPEKKQE